MSEYEALCEICGNKYDNYMRTFYIQYSKNDNDKKCVCAECWRKEAIVKPYRYTNEIPMSCDGGDFITRLFNTKEDLLQYVLDDTDDGDIACMDDDDNTIVDVNVNRKFWWVRGYANLDKNDLPNWKDKAIELYGENYIERN